MTKKVRYNGGTESYYGCSDPEKLIVGKEYNVISEKDRGGQTDYTLEGIEGTFNSVWFDVVNFGNKVYIAIADKTPIINEKYECSKIEFLDDSPKLIECSTSIVKEVNPLGNNVFQVTTSNSVYIVKVQ